MQPTYVMAFRKRLKKRGYTDIKIYRAVYSQDIYLVSAIEPLAGFGVQRECTIEFMHQAFK